jgi:hypothetical protein
MALLLIFACVPIGFVFGDCSLSIRRAVCHFKGGDVESLPAPAPAWMVDVAGIVATALLIITFPGRG